MIPNPNDDDDVPQVTSKPKKPDKPNKLSISIDSQLSQAMTLFKKGGRISAACSAFLWPIPDNFSAKITENFEECY